MKVLVVDDDGTYLDEIKVILEEMARKGAIPCALDDLYFASTLRKAKTILTQESIDLAIVDIKMEDDDSGLSLAPVLEEHSTDFVVVSAVKDGAVRTIAEREGALSYYEKPFEYSRLCDLLRFYERLMYGSDRAMVRGGQVPADGATSPQAIPSGPTGGKSIVDRVKEHAVILFLAATVGGASASWTACLEVRVKPLKESIVVLERDEKKLKGTIDELREKIKNMDTNKPSDISGK